MFSGNREKIDPFMNFYLQLPPILWGRASSGSQSAVVAGEYKISIKKSTYPQVTKKKKQDVKFYVALRPSGYDLLPNITCDSLPSIISTNENGNLFRCLRGKTQNGIFWVFTMDYLPKHWLSKFIGGP